MSNSLYAMTVPAWRQQLGAVSHLVGKAEIWCAENNVSHEELIGTRLVDDMAPFGYQVKSCAAHSVGAIEGVRAAVYSPDMGGWPQDLAGLKAKIDDADAALAALESAEIDALAGRDMAFVLGEMRMDFTAEDFLLSFSMPNFYFHATAAYMLLRQRGLSIGKRDFLGRPRLRG
jgi:uncharacterized protein